MTKEIKKLLIQADINPLIVDDFTNFLLELKGQNFAQFTDMVEDYFWTIANDCHIITKEDADDYYEENFHNFRQIAHFASIREFWVVENEPASKLTADLLADLSSVQISNYMFSKIEENKINKINEILFNLINQ